MEEKERIGSLEARVDNVEHVLLGNGQPGLNTIMRDYIAEQRGRDAERERDEKKRSRRTTTWLAILSIAIALFGIMPNIASTMKKFVSALANTPAIVTRSGHTSQDVGLTPEASATLH